tara:strand:+ start:54 stop:209 length:156 start_codon:yes stop_codon:yes gene_type:complete
MTESNKQKTKVFPLRIPPELHKKARFKALENDESLHGMILRLIEQEVNKEH